MKSFAFIRQAMLWVVFTISFSYGQSMKIEHSTYYREIKTNIMVASTVLKPTIRYQLACATRRSDCRLLIAGTYVAFTPTSQVVYPDGPNLVTYVEAKRVVVVVQRTFTASE